MIKKELKRLKRRELIDIIYQLKRNEQEMQEEIASLKKELEDKRFRLSSVGSIADAAISVSEILEAAQKTAETYLGEITAMKEDAENEREEMIEDARKKVKEILDDGNKEISSLKSQYHKEYKKLHKLQAEVPTEVPADEEIVNDEMSEETEDGE